MIRILFAGLLLYIGYRIISALAASGKTPIVSTGERGFGEDAHRDPVCGVYVSEESAVIGRHEGKRHFFCSMDCLEKYREQLEHISPPS